jgi:hypothetical protein
MLTSTCRPSGTHFGSVLQHLQLQYAKPKACPLCDFVHLTRVFVPPRILLNIPSVDTITTLARQLSETLPQSLVFFDMLLMDENWVRCDRQVAEELEKIIHERQAMEELYLNGLYF